MLNWSSRSQLIFSLTKWCENVCCVVVIKEIYTAIDLFLVNYHLDCFKRHAALTAETSMPLQKISYLGLISKLHILDNFYIQEYIYLIMGVNQVEPVIT